LTALPTALGAEEIDFSCMKERVRGKQQVTDRYKEYDVILHNQCPGAGYWSMCIERLDPWTSEILETHTPTGYIKAEQKSRVNLQMKKTPDASDSRHRFQEFYVTIGYAIDGPAKSPCIARQCEAKKTELRKKARSNDKAWQKAQQALAARIAAECPDTAWDNAAREDCEAELSAASQPDMERYAQADEQLKQELAAIDPDTCQLHAGGVAPD